MSILLTAFKVAENGMELLDEVQLDLAEVYARLDSIIKGADSTPTYTRHVEPVKSEGQDHYLYSVAIVSLRRGELISHVLKSQDMSHIGTVADYVRLRLTRLRSDLASA